MEDAWYSILGSQHSATVQEALGPLMRLGLQPAGAASPTAHGTGILFVTEPTPTLQQHVYALSFGGCARILVVAIDHEAIADDPWRLLAAGASDVLTWDDPTTCLDAIAARVERWRAIDCLLESPEIRDGIVGESPAWIAVLRQAIEAARFADAPVLIMGETGTGKEHIARLIHTLDAQRQHNEYVVVDCATIVPELAGSELFGHERGAFTSAIAARDGAFAVANGGTLFLDEIGDLPGALQPQLLRAVQEHVYKKVGSNTWRRTDFRLVTATNRNLLTDQTSGRFREDLYHRIAGWVISLPPLRARPEDIIPLVQHFMHLARPDHDPPCLSAEVRTYLLTRHYPGNVRDLKRLAVRIACRHVGAGPVTIGDIPEDERIPTGAAGDDCPDCSFDASVRRAFQFGAGLRDIRRLAEDAAIRIATIDEQGNLKRAAKRLGVTDRTLQQRRANQQQSEIAEPELRAV